MLCIWCTVCITPLWQMQIPLDIPDNIIMTQSMACSSQGDVELWTQLSEFHFKTLVFCNVRFAWISDRGRGTRGFFPLGSRQRKKISKSTAMSQMVQSPRSSHVDGRELMLIKYEILPWWRLPHGSPVFWIPTLPHPSCVIIGIVLSFSKAQVPYLNNGDVNALLGELLWGLNDFME